MVACFRLLDLRNRELVRHGEAALAVLERRLAASVSAPQIRLVKRAKRPGACLATYTNVVLLLTVAAVLIFVAEGTFAAFQAAANNGQKSAHAPSAPHSQSIHPSG
ncbi:hypothetical protein GCM10027515_30080 [Schumannella luteola]|uniref:Uncharacterized protein n=1 Tax=Schumannella luteola TaxID=472059 RepID=A0A852YDG0_9MICO|nr:hypothetical protein [Schumannella luteola]NYG99191.1 hypothetical protein [Schumannella luteola]TPW90536.1 hypothetical protein FJ656_36920 [Schumannella luteola]